MCRGTSNSVTSSCTLAGREMDTHHRRHYRMNQNHIEGSWARIDAFVLALQHYMVYKFNW